MASRLLCKLAGKVTASPEKSLAGAHLDALALRAIARFDPASLRFPLPTPRTALGTAPHEISTLVNAYKRGATLSTRRWLPGSSAHCLSDPRAVWGVSPLQHDWRGQARQNYRTLRAGRSLKQIGANLGVFGSTVARELTRAGVYRQDADRVLFRECQLSGSEASVHDPMRHPMVGIQHLLHMPPVVHTDAGRDQHTAPQVRHRLLRVV